MDISVLIQSTPNPNAMKFVVNVPVKTEGKAIYRAISECGYNLMARTLFVLPGICEVYFFDNYITMTQDGTQDWAILEESVRKILIDYVPFHDPNFKIEETKPIAPRSEDPEIQKIDEILDRTIRPALQMDGGDVVVIAYESKALTIAYQGACGSCPSGTMGTLQAIESILKNEYDPMITVSLAY